MGKQKFKYNAKTLSYEKVKSSNNYNWGKVLLLIVIILAILYFIIGGGFVIWGDFKINTYLNLGGVFGALASIAGLLSLFSSRVKRSDIEEIGIDYFKDVVKASENLKQKESDLKAREKELGLKEKEIRELEIKKAELELLVQKASLTLYLKDKLSRLNEEIIEYVNNDKGLLKAFEDRENIKHRLLELDEELEENDEGKKIEEIIKLVKHAENTHNDEQKPKSYFDESFDYFRTIINRFTRL